MIGNLVLCEEKSLSHQCFDSDNQLLYTERFFQVIIRSEFKPLHHIIDGRTGSQE